MKRYIATKVVPTFAAQSEKKTIYTYVQASGQSGMDRMDIAAKMSIDATRISFFLSELRRDGYICVLGDPSSNVAPTMNSDEAAFAAMLGLENALIAKARELKKTDKAAYDAMNVAFVRYQKFKTASLAVPSPTSSAAQIIAEKNVVAVALRGAIIELVKAVF